MTPDYRAMCAELLAAIQLYTQLNPAASAMSAFELTEKLMDAMAATVAALAEPEAEGPTDEETEEAAKLIHASMRFAVPPSHSTCDWVERGNSLMQDEARKTARAVLDRWGRPTPQPVPLSERLPGPEDCNAEEMCWWLIEPYPRPVGPGGKLWSLCRYYPGAALWLPAHALPLPQVEEGKQ